MSLTSLLLLLVGPLLATGEDQPAPRPAAEAAEHFTLPEGFRATLFAGEPDITQPIAVAFDDRGRLWVVECHAYPKWQEEGTGKDRVVILEDADGDGRFDKKTVFLDNGTNLTGIELGFGGIWLTAVPNLLFVPDANQDDQPDSPPQVVLDGFDLKARHNVLNGLVWGPDGWLYGCNGILSNSRVGAPGAPDEARTEINCGIWRFHPTRKVFEAVAHGTTNPWGLAFDARGEMFLTNCVIEHVFHVIPGARYRRMFGQDFNPHTFQRMQTCADHIHWAGGDWQAARGGDVHDQFGGGHAHSGAMVYLGNNWPQEFRGNLFTCNIHGNRVNRDTLQTKGSGYVASHAPDVLKANDSWFRGLAVKYGPDGGVYVLDWSDTGECHDYEDIHRENGRIFKVTFGSPATFREDFRALSDSQLIERLSHANHWHRNHARRLLQERAARKALSPTTTEELGAVLEDHPAADVQLQALWALHALGGLTDSKRFQLLNHADETLRGWMIRLEAEGRSLDPLVQKLFAEQAQKDPSPYVRLQLASILQRLEPEQRRAIALELVAHAEDASDANLPLMIWYAIEPLVGQGSDGEVLRLVEAARIPLVRQFIARRLAVENPPRLAPLLQLLKDSTDTALQHDLLVGIHTGLEGRNELRLPAGWPEVYAHLASSTSENVHDVALRLALMFGDPTAAAELQKLALNQASPPVARRQAFTALLAARQPVSFDLLVQLLDDSVLRSVAISGLANFDNAAAAKTLLALYKDLAPTDQKLAIGTLISRPLFAKALLAAVESGDFPRRDLTEYDLRQLGEIPGAEFQQQLKRVIVAIRPTSEERAALIAKMKQMVLAGDPAQASAARGRIVFEKNCATCHTLFGSGRQVGPDLTGSQRNNLDYVLINVLDPNALVGGDYQITQIVTTDGRVIGGIIKAEDENTLTLATAAERIVLAKDEIEQRKASRVSMMPEGLLPRLPEQEIRDLIHYLASPQQVPLP